MVQIYEVAITEMLCRKVFIRAVSEEEAVDIVKLGYNSERYVLGSEDFQDVDFLVLGSEEA